MISEGHELPKGAFYSGYVLSFFSDDGCQYVTNDTGLLHNVIICNKSALRKRLLPILHMRIAVNFLRLSELAYFPLLSLIIYFVVLY
jgi:hypothetical protein